MRQERRSKWYEWTCDLIDCDAQATSHPVLEDLDPPPGWVTISPPPFWRGPELSFCSIAHRNEWAQATVGPLLLGDGAKR